MSTLSGRCARYVAARSDPACPGETLVRIADQLVSDAREFDDLLDSICQEVAELRQLLFTGTHASTTLLQLVREEHDHNHFDAWLACGFPICRQAGEEGQA